MGTVPVYRQGRTYHVSADEAKGNAKVVTACALGIFLIAVPAILIGAEWQYHTDLEAFHEVEDDVVELDHAKRQKSPQIVHLQSTNVSVVSQDPQFGVSVDGALSLERVTEYCQWRQNEGTSCQQCPDATGSGTHDCDCTKTYSYVKDWYNQLYVSTFYDQPAKYYNPQRDPYPSTSFFATSARVTCAASGLSNAILGPALLTGKSIRATSRRVEWTLGALPTPSYFRSLFGIKDTKRYAEIRDLQSTRNSQAYTTDKFVYVGQGGFFFSRYQGDRYGPALQLLRAVPRGLPG